MKTWLHMAVGIFVVVPMFGQTGTSRDVRPVPILMGADLPMYPPIWRAAHLSGKVTVLVTVRNGRVLDVQTKSGDSHLAVPTIANIKSWRFADTVNEQFPVVFTYQIAGKPTDLPTNPEVEMLPSLDVNMTARPVKPTCSDCGASPSISLPAIPR